MEIENEYNNNNDITDEDDNVMYDNDLARAIEASLLDQHNDNMNGRNNNITKRKQRPNDVCKCGSGLKYKICCKDNE